METKNNQYQEMPNILIVDDMPANLTLLGAILRSEGYRIRPVPNGILALQAAEKEKPDLILLDIMMPNMNGYEVCSRLKENPDLKDIPVIYISALNATHDVVKALTSGGVDFITKPFQAEEVKARIATHLKIQQQSKELIDLNATKDKFFSIIAHDLRNPFSVLLGMSDLLLNNYDSYDNETRLELISIQNETTKQTFTLLENLLEWSKMKRGKFDFSPEKISLKDIISQNIESNRALSTQKGIKLSNLLTDNLFVDADTNMLQTILRNLIVNAIKFTHKGGQITFTSASFEDHLEIRITDNGVGMTQETKDKLFRIDSNSTTQGTEKEKGSGLGLILCKEFVEKHGGEIWVESTVGEGSTFAFTLPKSIEDLKTVNSI